MSDERSTDPRVLREMVRQAQEERLPDLDWDRVEQRLFAEVDGSTPPNAEVERASRAPLLVAQALGSDDGRPSLAPRAEATLKGAEATTGHRAFRWVAALALAAAFALVWLGGPAPSSDVVAAKDPIDPATLPLAAGLGGSRDVAALESGDVVEAAIGPLAFGKLGVLEWTLAAGGRLVVQQALSASDGHIQVVELEAGSIHGAVGSGALVVTAGETEIATLGQAVMRVTRSSSKVVVDLQQGAVSVGPRGQRARGRVVTAPLLASFSLDGGKDFRVLPDPVSAAVAPQPAQVDAPAEAPAPVVDAPAAKAPPAAVHEPRAPVAAPPVAEVAVVEPPAEPPALSDAAVSATLHGCLTKVRAQPASGSPEVSVSLASTLRVETRDDGSVKSASFNPPLRPELQACAVFLFKSRLSGGARVLSVPVSIK